MSLNRSTTLAREATWKRIHYSLAALFILTAALNMLRLRVGFLTNHAADVVVPAWLYVVSRGLHSWRGAPGVLQRTIGRSAPSAALILFVASALTEASQYFWPHGVFPGTFDPLDVVAYAAGVGVMYAAERWWLGGRVSAPASQSRSAPA